MLTFQKTLFACALALGSVGAIACSGTPSEITDENGTDEGTEEIKSSFCGGIAGIQCPTGYQCKLDGNYPDAGGTCIKAKGEGAYCGGFAGISCPKGYSCKLQGNYPDASGTCHKTGNVCVQNTLCVQGSRWDALLCQCVKAPTCLTLTCAKSYHCEMKGLNGGSVGVCIHN